MAKKKKKEEKARFKWPYGPRNYIIFAVGIAAIIIGYIALGLGSISIAPILLVLGYCVLIPISIIIRDNKASAPPTEE